MLKEYDDKYKYCVISQSHRGFSFAPGNFDDYFPGRRITYKIGNYNITLFSMNCPQLYIKDKDITVYVGGTARVRDSMILEYSKALYYPIEAIKAAVNIYNFGVDDVSYRISIKRR